MDVIDKPDLLFGRRWLRVLLKAHFTIRRYGMRFSRRHSEINAIFTKGFIFEDGVRAIFPIVRISSGGFFTKRDRAKSSAFGEYGNIVSEKELSSQQQALIYKSLKDMNVKLRVCTNPFSKYILPPEFKQKESFTQVLSLDRGVESVYKNFTKKARQSCTKAERLGVSVRPIEKSEVKAYFDIYAETISRWGKKTIFSYPEEIFHNIAEIAGDRAKIWVAEKEGKMIAGLVAFYWNGIVHALAGSRPERIFLTVVQII